MGLLDAVYALSVCGCSLQLQILAVERVAGHFAGYVCIECGDI